jgi:hypothetical protein
MMETLEGLKSGRYWVTTHSGTRHLVNLDERSVTRYGAPGHEWNEGNPNSVAGVDGEPYHYDRLSGATVGESMYMTAGGGYLYGTTFRQTSTVQSIEKIEDEE